jgi:cytochrome c oxidase cbb3-type subunit 3
VSHAIPSQSLEFLAIVLLAALLNQPAFSDVPPNNTVQPVDANANAVQVGASRFRISCALCHGLHAQGGSRGPDLTRGTWSHGGSDAEIFATIRQGVSGTLMAPHDMTDAETWAIVAYLRSLAPGPMEAVRGDPNKGRQLFFGEATCSNCHMVEGEGGRLGPDLSNVGAARSPDYLARKIRGDNDALAVGLKGPEMDWPREYEEVTIVKRDGKTVSGVLRNEDLFSIQFMDLAENLQLYLKKDLQTITVQHKSVMPAFGDNSLNESKLEDIVAYLDGLRGLRASK